MALDIGTLVAKVKVDDGDFDKKADGWSTKGAAIGSAFGNIAANAIGAAANALSDYIGDAIEASDATAKFEQTMQFAGLDTSTIDAMREATQAYADTTIYSLGDIQSITATLAANGVKDYDTLAMSLGNLNAAAGGNAETFGRVGSVLTQTAGAGKLTTENWNQLTDAIPGAAGRLMDALLNAGAYTGNFREAMEKGEITAEEFNAAISSIGNEPIAVEAAQSTKTFEGAAGNLAASIQGQLVTALELVKGPINDVTNFLADLISNTEVFIPVAAGLGAVILAALAPAIWAAVVATAAWTVALLANPITWIVLAIGALVAAIVWLIMNWDTAVAWISEVWAGFISWFQGVMDGFISWWTGLWDGLMAGIATGWEAVVAWFQNLPTMIGEFFAGVGEWLLSIGQMLLEGLATGIAMGVVAIWYFFTQFPIDLLNFLIGAGEWLLQTGLDLLTGLWNGIVAGYIAVSTWFQNLPAAILAFLITAAQWLLDTGRSIIDGLRSGITTAWNAVVAWFVALPGVVVGFLAAAGSWLISSGRSIIDGARNGIVNGWSAVVSWFQGLPGMIAGFFSGAGSWLWNAGANIVQGLLDGVASLASTVGSFFLDLLPGWIVGPFKAALGIASPSRLFREFGGFIGDGLIEGLEDMADPIDAQMRRMVSVPPFDVPPPPGGGFGDEGSGGGSSKTLIYNAAPAQSFNAQEEFFNAMGSPRVAGF